VLLPNFGGFGISKVLSYTLQTGFVEKFFFAAIKPIKA
jgi:hypothetical protein